MNSLFKVILSFIPWSVYSWVMNTSLSFRDKFALWCLLLIFIVTINRHLLLQGEAITLSNLLSFIFIFVNYQFDLIPILTRYPASLCYLLLAIVAAGSLILKKPFTIKFAGDSLPEEKKRHKIFYLINRNITFIWLGVFMINCALNFYYSWSLTLRLVCLSLIVLALLASHYFPEIMRDHYRKRFQSASPSFPYQDNRGK
ncbi:hypothetical protein [Pantoea ananatis]|uniref:hypothetical protein n=1 Tax=Pantoea ananas TaxID=553 RepID=UPI001B314964|nr:hypothetical protein [Pantoea ananatis]